ncbi:hypothetical protein JTE90_001557 [Oedothorax gibbosus]|uniref:Granulins domain-containing protein n=1 Tax=Oedothorax gibbosus TaxID=931172 RepID=A0AAV6VP74_9ARAC|nr:hypothetical protein JTE90_001557 [Oedothorax gibbosus]
MFLLYSSVILFLVVSVRSDCPSNFCYKSDTCCTLSSGAYACCPFENAVCCPDKKHCCPSGTTCDDATGKCRTQLGRLTNGTNGLPTNVSANADDCMYCEKDTPCCPLVTGGHACCPFKYGTCCEHSIYCCPGQNKCDLSSGWCKV